MNRFLKIFHPKSGIVNSNYNRYIGWSAVSTFLISAESVLATHSMLSAVTAAPSEMSVSMNYIGKDIIGQIGGIFLINRFGHYSDNSPLKFVKWNMGLQQICTLLECITPLLPSNVFILFASLGNMGKNLSFMGFGAINAKIIKELALEDNIGEIYSKITAINTLSSTLGMGFGLLIASCIPNHGLRICVVPILGIARYLTYKIAIRGIIQNAK